MQIGRTRGEWFAGQCAGLHPTRLPRVSPGTLPVTLHENGRGKLKESLRSGDFLQKGDAAGPRRRPPSPGAELVYPTRRLSRTVSGLTPGEARGRHTGP